MESPFVHFNFDVFNEKGVVSRFFIAVNLYD